VIGEASSDIRVESGDRTSGVTGLASAPYKGAEWKLRNILYSPEEQFTTRAATPVPTLSLIVHPPAKRS